MKTPKPQPVIFSKNRYDIYIENEKQTKFMRLYNVKIYDASGIVATLNEYSLTKQMNTGESFTIDIPVVWNTRKVPDFTETRAHIVAENVGFERRYNIFIPIEAVTIESVKDIASKGTGYTERYYTVAGFPAKFSKWYRHPFNTNAGIDAAHELENKAYDILDNRMINTPRAQKYLTEFWQQLQEFAAEAARVDALNDADYIAECLAAHNA